MTVNKAGCWPTANHPRPSRGIILAIRGLSTTKVRNLSRVREKDWRSSLASVKRGKNQVGGTRSPIVRFFQRWKSRARLRRVD